MRAQSNSTFRFFKQMCFNSSIASTVLYSTVLVFELHNSYSNYL
uniref:Uncharacterized protein n=1 Tax=Arundo donax TaxID=35708 RepID=A0A0A9G862_ARUDO